MITDFALSAVFGLAEAFLGFLPDWSPPDSIPTTSVSLGIQAHNLDAYTPVGLVFICLAAILGYKVVLTVWRFVVFVYDRFPFKAT